MFSLSLPHGRQSNRSVYVAIDRSSPGLVHKIKALLRLHLVIASILCTFAT
jgi:hypothetical protein